MFRSKLVVSTKESVHDAPTDSIIFVRRNCQFKIPIRKQHRSKKPTQQTIMVLISLKSTLPRAQSSNDGFLYETLSSTKVDDLIDSLVEIHNARLRSCLIIDAVRGLATYGVMKRPEDAGTDEVRSLFVWMLFGWDGTKIGCDCLFSRYIVRSVRCEFMPCFQHHSHAA